MKLNDAYTQWQYKQGGAAVGHRPTTLRYPQQALPIVSTQEDMIAQNEAAVYAGQPEYELATSTIQTYTALQSDQVGKKIGVPTDQVLERLQKVLAKHEIPVGLVAKLFQLERFGTLYFNIDDSGSMNSATDSFHADGSPMTRWDEVFIRVKTLFEIIAYVPIQKVHVAFLNRNDDIDIVRKGETPEQFLQHIGRKLDQHAARRPSGGNPDLRAITKAMAVSGSKSIYYFGDGGLDHGEMSGFEKLLIGRKNPQDSPVTFMSCTNNDADVEW